MSSKIDLSVVIVSYNVKDLIFKNLKSIFLFTKDLSYKIYVVDNGSSDGTCEYLENEFCDQIDNDLLKIYNTKNNNGFSKGNNIPLSDMNSKYVLYMNPDMEIVENSFYKLFKMIDDRSDFDIVTCKLKYPDNDIQHGVKGLPSFIVNLMILFKMHHFFRFLKSFKNYFLSGFDYEKESYVKQIMGAFVLIRKDVIDNIGGWNEDYWLWWEDVDLCKRIDDLNLKILYTPITYVIHYEGKSFDQVATIEKQKRFNKGMLIYSKKYFPYYQYVVLKILSPISLLLAFVVKTFKIKPIKQGRI